MEVNSQIKKGRKVRNIALVVLSVLLCAACAFSVYWFATADDRQYQQGVKLMNAGSYEAAIEIFEALPGHDQASARIREAKYLIATDLMENKQYQEAADIYGLLNGYQDSAQQAQICYYTLGTNAQIAGKYESARSYFSLAGEHRDAHFQVQRMTYFMGHAAFLEGDYETANDLFAQLEGDQSVYGYPHFETLADAVEYLEQQRLNLNTAINFHIDAEANEEFYKTLKNVFPCEFYYPHYYAPNKLLTIAGIHYYPGENILYAWRNNDASRLTEEERQVLDLAEQIIDQAKKETENDHELERWLHDWLCNRVMYESPNMDVSREEFIQLRELTCVGAMLDGAANCQGYADAFYLLGNMAGFDVDKIFGSAGEGHVWNAIWLNGQRYIVDVTFDDMSDKKLNGWSYTYFNTFWDPKVYDPFGDDEAGLEVTAEPDLTQTYFHQTDRIFTNLNALSQSLINQNLNNNSKWTYAMIENTSVDHDALTAALKTLLYRYTGDFYWTQWIEYYGGNSYIIVCWQ